MPRGPSKLELGTLRSVSLPRFLLFCTLRLLQATGQALQRFRVVSGLGFRGLGVRVLAFRV